MADDVFRDWAVRATLGDTRNEVVGPDDPPEIYNAGEDQARVFYRYLLSGSYDVTDTAGAAEWLLSAKEGGA